MNLRFTVVTGWVRVYNCRRFSAAVGFSVVVPGLPLRMVYNCSDISHLALGKGPTGCTRTRNNSCFDFRVIYLHMVTVNPGGYTQVVNLKGKHKKYLQYVT